MFFVAVIVLYILSCLCAFYLGCKFHIKDLNYELEVQDVIFYAFMSLLEPSALLALLLIMVINQTRYTYKPKLIKKVADILNNHFNKNAK